MFEHRSHKACRGGFVEGLDAHLVLAGLTQTQQLVFVKDFELAVLRVALLGYAKRYAPSVPVEHPHRHKLASIAMDKVEGACKPVVDAGSPGRLRQVGLG